MKKHEAEPTGKFKQYRDEINELARGSDQAAVNRAEYEKSLMSKSCFVELNGVVHHYHDSCPKDAKTTVLLVHGWDCWWMWWHYIIRALNKEGIRTIAYDLKGHGWSDNDPRDNYAIETFSEDMAALVDALDLDGFHVAAFSFGPFVALDYAKKHPDKIRSMTLFNFGYLDNNEVIENIAPLTINFMFNNLLRKINWWLPVYMFARLVLARNTVLYTDILIGFNGLSLCSPVAIEQTTNQITSLSVTRSVPGLVEAAAMPLLFVAGDGDPVMTCESTEKLVAYNDRARFVCVPQCGHLITLELPETASGLILEHVKACS